jgi:hypothetical protein
LASIRAQRGCIANPLLLLLLLLLLLPQVLQLDEEASLLPPTLDMQRALVGGGGASIHQQTADTTKQHSTHQIKMKNTHSLIMSLSVTNTGLAASAGGWGNRVTCLCVFSIPYTVPERMNYALCIHIIKSAKYKGGSVCDDEHTSCAA